MEELIDEVRKSVVESYLVKNGIAVGQGKNTYIIDPKYHHIFPNCEGPLNLDQTFNFLRIYLRQL